MRVDACRNREDVVFTKNLLATAIGRRTSATIVAIGALRSLELRNEPAARSPSP